MQQYTYWVLSLCVHVPVHAAMLASALLNPSREKASRSAIAKGWPPPVVALMKYYCHLTTCAHLLMIVYLLLSVHGGYQGARSVSRALNWTISTTVGIFWQVLSSAKITRGGPRPPWTMLPREEFPASDEAAHWAADRLLHPSWSPLMPIYCALQLQHTAMPIAPWAEQLFWREEPALSLATEVCALVVYAAGWLMWSIVLCWRVRGVPPYPVLATVHAEGLALRIYGGIIGSALLVAVAAHYF